MRAPADALPVLTKQLRPVPRLDPKQIAALLANLDDTQVAVRERAATELRRLGELAESTLRRALRANVALESGCRIDRILEALENRPPPQTLRALRRMEILERIGPAEARAQLQALAAGEPAVPVTRQASESLRRLERGRGG